MNVMIKSLEALGTEIVKYMGDHISSDSGKLKTSFTIDVTEKNGVATLEIYNDEDYGEFVNDGTKPHMPPVDAIRSWAERKGINPWAVAMSIKKYGTKAHPYIPEDSDIARMINKLDLSEYLYDLIDEKIFKK